MTGTGQTKAAVALERVIRFAAGGPRAPNGM
jgi:hypothetical protein